MSRHLTIALDLGQRVDHTALAIVEKLQPRPGDFDADLPDPIYHVVDLHRWGLARGAIGGYRSIINDLGRRLGQDQWVISSPMYYDVTGPGNEVRPIIMDAWRDGRLPLEYAPNAVTITGMQTTTRATTGARRGVHVAKLDLVTLSGSLLDEKRLVIPPGLPFADVLQQEIAGYEMRVSKKGDAVYEAGRQGKHDDLVFAVMLGLFFASKSNRECRIIPYVGAEAVDIPV